MVSDGSMTRALRCDPVGRLDIILMKFSLTSVHAVLLFANAWSEILCLLASVESALKSAMRIIFEQLKDGFALLTETFYVGSSYHVVYETPANEDPSQPRSAAILSARDENTKKKLT